MLFKCEKFILVASLSRRWHLFSSTLLLLLLLCIRSIFVVVEIFALTIDYAK